MNELGQMLKDARKRHSITTSQVAEQVGVSQGYISHIENGRKIPTPEVLQKISKILEIPFMELMTKAGHIKTFGQSIKELREEKGWTIEELEKETINYEYGGPIYVNQKTLTQLESGEYKKPSVYEIYLLSYALGVPPWTFSTFDLKTPEADLVEFLDTPNKPEPIKFMNNLLSMLIGRLNSRDEDDSDKDDIMSKIQDIENNKKRYIKQLNQLTLNGEKIIEEESYVESEEEKFEKLKVMLLSESPTYMNGIELTNKQKEMILQALNGNLELLNEHMTLKENESEKD
ncbi:helix-turn-helix domain-containing protein [Lysinibacillus capsici]|uniref:helix-turn-helix domain-containing protein n=1 Tax=Lysinibacillus capsici TaxID=2115968 RepID=UPI0034E1A303